MRELVASHVEDQQRSAQAETNAGKWDPPDMGPNKQVSKMVPSYHGPAYSPKIEYELVPKTRLHPWTCVKELTYGLLTLEHPTM
jgi:hypothetical protein